MEIVAEDMGYWLGRISPELSYELSKSGRKRVLTLSADGKEALVPLVELTRSGGLLLVSTRSHYYEETDFQQQIDVLIAAGRIEQTQVIRDAPYNHDGDAHYWVFRKLKSCKPWRVTTFIPSKNCKVRLKSVRDQRVGRTCRKDFLSTCSRN